MPAAEADVSHDEDRGSYEFAFHILPTVAEGEVPQVFADLKTLVENAGGTIFDEEAPQRFDLAYEIVKYVEGKNRSFTSAYFGWIRFRLPTENIAELSEEIDSDQRLLRYLIIRLTKVEEAHPFRFHESLKEKKVSTVEDEDVAPAPEETETAPTDAEGTEAEKKDKVDDEELDEALKKDEV